MCNRFEMLPIKPVAQRGGLNELNKQMNDVVLLPSARKLLKSLNQHWTGLTLFLLIQKFRWITTKWISIKT